MKRLRLTAMKGGQCIQCCLSEEHAHALTRCYVAGGWTVETKRA